MSYKYADELKCKSNRQKAIEWWNNLMAAQKILFAKDFGKNSFNITTKEIEEIWQTNSQF